MPGRKKLAAFLFILAIISLTTCKTPYTPGPISAVSNYLVVEGFINISDSTYINLSRTVSLTATSTVKPELKAVITIENNQGGSYPLKELGNGVYAAAPLSLTTANQYRVRIKTSNGNQYLSDFTVPVVSPPVDSITWKPTSTTLNIAVNTHDPNNATHYYRWDFIEAWEFHPSFDSGYISDGLHILPRTPAQDIWDCFTGDASSNINVGTSIQLSQDIISQQVINTIPSSAEKISIKYTIGVKQYGLTKDAYDYWTLLQKNTEQLGSIFDAQPSASIGNIHNIANANEPVIGYISAGTITTSRIFITKSQLPGWLTTPFYPNCELDSVFKAVSPQRTPRLIQNVVINYKSSFYTGALQIPVYPFPDPVNKSDTGYMSAAPMCVDCTLRGSKTPPAYWK
jgi:Domain of unknown function (DUF4249)